MRTHRKTAAAAVLAAALLAATSAPAPAQEETSVPPAPTNLEVTKVTHFTVGLAWAGTLETGSKFLINWDQGDNNWHGRSTSTARSKTLGVTPDSTYTYEVRVVTADGQESEPSNQVTVTTPAYVPPDDVEAEHDGNDVTLTWSRPANLPSGRNVNYRVYHNGLLETQLWNNADDASQVSISRAASGTTHDYTVRMNYHIGSGTIGGWTAPSVPAVVTVPPLDDTTPPTAPVWVFGPATPEDCQTGFFGVTIVEESTDDTTPQSEIRYEGLRSIVLASDEFWIYDYDLPSRTDEGPYHNQWEVVVYNKIRAVDEAGNRSEPVIPIYIGDQVCAG